MLKWPHRVRSVILLTAVCFALALPAAAQTAVAGRVQPPALIAFSNAWDRVTGYSATVTIFERKDAEVQNVVFDYTFHKPSNLIVHVLAGPNAGVTLEWSGGPTMIARKGSGLMALFKRTISLHDPLATTIRGSSLDQLSFGAILAHGQQTAGQVSQASVIDNGVDMDALTLLPADPATDGGMSMETVEISSTTHLPTRIAGYEDKTLVRSIEFSNVKLQP